MSTQQEIDLEARIGELERQLAEVAAKVNPLYSGGMDRYIHSGYMQWDGIPIRFGPMGLMITATTQPTITGETERKLAWTSSDFASRYAEVFGSYYSALSTKYMISRVHDGTDAYHVSGIIKSNLTDWDAVQWISKIGGGDLYPWHVDNGSTPLIALEYVDSSNMKLYVRKNGALAEIGGGMSLIVKEADETVNNSAALQNDNELLFAVAANEVWQFEGVLFIVAGTAEDFQMTFTGPTGAVGSFGGILKANSSSGVNSSGAAALGSSLFFQPSTDTGVLRFWGGIHNGANAGNLTLQWAQRVATVVDTKVLAGSYIKYQAES